MKPNLIQQIETQTRQPLKELPRPEDLSQAVRHKNNLSYVLDDSGNLLALNVTGTESLTGVAFGEADCASLQYLNLGENKNLQTATFAAALPRLRYLDLSVCLLGELTLPAGCGELEKAWLQKSGLLKMVFGGACPKLLLLDLSGNWLVELALPGGFDSLAYLYLSDNRLKEVSFRKVPRKLEILHLKDNQLEKLPDNLLFFDKMETLYLHGNPLPGIPKEFISNEKDGNSWPSVRSYLQSQKKSGMVDLWQAKMILVGNGEVGKSSIRIKLMNPGADLPLAHERTQGLDIETYMVEGLEQEITGLESPIDFQLNIWDFGGQGKYREVQQLFCSRKSLYLFVTAHDDSPEKEDYVGFEYWLSMVNAFSFDEQANHLSPVIHVVNKIDVTPALVEEKTVKDRFPNIDAFVKISCKELTNFGQLKEAIRRSLKNVSTDIFTYRISTFWMAVKTELEERQKDHHISWADYMEICNRHSLDENEARTWIDVLDIIGVVIYFGKNEALSDWVVLNPLWVKDAMYKVLDSPLVQGGILKPAYFPFIWQDYTPDEQQKLAELMLAYRLCYRQTGPSGKEEYVLPALLSEEKPPLPGHLQSPDFQLKLCYQPFIPAGAVNKLMVALHGGEFASQPSLEMLEGTRAKDVKPVQAQVYNNLMWKNNVVVHDPLNNVYAHVSEDWEAKTVYIDLYGDEAEPLFEHLHFMLESLNQSLKNMKYLSHLSLAAFGWRKGKWRNLGNLKDDGIDFFTQTKPSDMMNPVHELIAQARLREALEALLQTVPDSAKNEVLQLQAKLSELERRERIGVLSYSEANVEKAKITDAALQLCSQPPTPPRHKGDSGAASDKQRTGSPKIYFSYAWGDDHETGESREKIVNDLYDSLLADGFDVRRDKMNIEYGGLISEFMREIGQGDLVAVFVSDKYLRSVYCMWELCEIYRNSLAEREKFAGRILPVRVESLALDKPKVLMDYLKYWKDFFEEWNEMVREYPQQVGKPQLDAFEKSRTIKDRFGDVVGYFQDMNARTKAILAKNDFAEVKQNILARVDKTVQK